MNDVEAVRELERHAMAIGDQFDRPIVIVVCLRPGERMHSLVSRLADGKFSLEQAVWNLRDLADELEDLEDLPPSSVVLDG